jgi:hypothetical protein
VEGGVACQGWYGGSLSDGTDWSRGAIFASTRCGGSSVCAAMVTFAMSAHVSVKQQK